MRFYFPVILLFLISCHGREQIKSKSSSSSPASSLSYEDLKTKIHTDQINLQKQYRDTNTKDSAVTKTRNYLIELISNELYHHWKGTLWDFNGTTTKPKEGKIACGFFVTTLLKDAGVSIDRTKLAICPSLTMMKELTSSKSIQNMSALNYADFISSIRHNGKNLFIVGLDFHTGFMVNDGNELWFIHSNYINKAGVTKEKSRGIACITVFKNEICHLSNL